ncbi:hypothetical protein TNCV_3607541 [Trichonephila clavipes]|nr:hypothetical protein TNCV_3607541 [Trichonephila clavipes]
MSRLLPHFRAAAAPPVLTSKNKKGLFPVFLKSKKKNYIEEQKEKLRIEEREEKLRFEQLRLDEQKRKDEFELEKLRIETQSKLGTDTSKESDTKFLVKEISKFIHRFDLKEDISLYLKLFERKRRD